MYKLLIFPLIILSLPTFSFDKNEASALASNLKKNLLSNVKEAMGKGGPTNAIGFCNINAMALTDKESTKNYSLSRTSLKVRNSKNTPTIELKSYLNEFAKSSADKPMADKVVTLKSGKKALLSPLYMQPACLVCHGEKIAAPVSKLLKELYPNDMATGYKAKEFRGFVVVSEKE